MPITTLDGYVGSVKQPVIWMKTGTRTLVAAMPFSVFDIAGQPGAGTLAIGNTANGVVHTSATTGYPSIMGFGSGAHGYIARAEFSSSVACRITVYDRLFAAGAYAFNADVTLTNQPSFASRIIDSNYRGLELWVETVTAFTGNLSIQINYLDENGDAGDTGVVATGVAPTVGRCIRIPLAAGDSGIQRIDRVRATVATAGTFNVMILRSLVEGRIAIANGFDSLDMLRTGFPRIFDTSALYYMLYADSTAVGLPYVTLQVASG